MTIAQQPFNSVFRRERPVMVFGPDRFDQGVWLHDTAPIITSSMVSVQRVGDNKAKELAERGIVGREMKRLYGCQFLPMENEPVVGKLYTAAEATDLTADGDKGPFVIDFFNPDKHSSAVLPAGQKTPKSPAARVKIDGVWFEVIQRIEMLNGVLSNYEYYVARLPVNDQQL